MNIYSSLAKLFPRSFSAKIFFIAFIGTHIPLILTVWFLFAGRGGLSENLDVFMVVLVATLAGTVATLYGLRAILQPLYQVHSAMAAFEHKREKIGLSHDFRDEIGEIMSMTNRLISSVDKDLREKTDDARTDPLTGLMNRRGFETTVTPGYTGAVIYADLDDFKLVNDDHGHDAGDHVLQEVANILRQTMRKDDIISRFGGEEFVAFLPDTEVKEAMYIADRARREISKTRYGEIRKLTASFGVAYLTSKDTMKSAINAADQALYKAKSEGRNKVAYSSEQGILIMPEQ